MSCLSCISDLERVILHPTSSQGEIFQNYPSGNLINSSSSYETAKRNVIIGTTTSKTEMEQRENNTNSLDIKQVASVSKMMDAKHILHSAIFHPVLREWQSKNSTNFDSYNLMLPIFVTDEEVMEYISSMPGMFRMGVKWVKSVVAPLVRKGLKSILLFGVIKTLPKDARGTHADSEQNPVIRALPILKSAFPDLIIACDVCLCPYTSLGHCGIIGTDDLIDNTASIKRLAEVALAYAKAGAHIVAPSDMMDGRVAAIKQSLIINGFSHKVAVLSYSAKFASTLYGPFREASGSAPAKGDRRCYQLPSGSAGLAVRAAARDVNEGADMLMVKPGLPYLDIVKRIKDAHPEYPLFVYQVSGEYAMLHHAANNNVFELMNGVVESITAMRRAGADCIITYFTPLLLNAWYRKSKY
ncbi:PREDICTED: delta-aminolevulinic acid dehydratase isoform X2 [Dinoponera quadriceps]|uniref:Delta-aminolevulinic acid dehydratase n=1 Tax=Dinoponera quadriceps TaxID=609295 RepID=A0A6P3Y565_DINQU|nr:PREDICTED: delta-aminolevulinic acid dehydratase isoform X2 [Dinoponera quadriceps]